VSIVDIEKKQETIEDSLFLLKKQLKIDAFMSIPEIFIHDTINFSIIPNLPIPDFLITNLNVTGKRLGKNISLKNNINSPYIFSISGTKDSISTIHISYNIIGTWLFSSSLCADSILYKMYIYLSDIENLILNNEYMNIKKIKFIESNSKMITFPFFDIDDKGQYSPYFVEYLLRNYNIKIQ
jgi:hypothetical protein